MSSLFSCNWGGKVYLNTEILCPDGSAILIKFVNAKLLGEAIKKAYDKKKKYGTSEKYTTFVLEDGRSFYIQKIPPEVMMNCTLRESVMGVIDQKYVHEFE